MLRIWVVGFFLFVFWVTWLKIVPFYFSTMTMLYYVKPITDVVRLWSARLPSFDLFFLFFCFLASLLSHVPIPMPRGSSGSPATAYVWRPSPGLGPASSLQQSSRPVCRLLGPWQSARRGKLPALFPVEEENTCLAFSSNQKCWIFAFWPRELGVLTVFVGVTAGIASSSYDSLGIAISCKCSLDGFYNLNLHLLC